MPRSSITRRQKDEQRVGSELLEHPTVKEVTAQAWQEFSVSSKLVSLSKIAGHLGIAQSTLQAKARNGEIQTVQANSNAPHKVTRDAVYSLIKGYAPRLAGWRQIVTVGKELGFHRNYIESYLKRSNHSSEMCLAADHILYISPEGEKVLQEHHEKVTRIKERETLTHFAKRTRYKANQVTAYFSARNIPLDHDEQGHVRLSDEQKQSFLLWKNGVQERKACQDIFRKGVLYRPIKAVAQQKAALLAKPGTRVFNQIVTKEVSALRYHIAQGHSSLQEERTSYIPVESAKKYVHHLQIQQAARLLDVSVTTIKNWTSNNPMLRAEAFDGRASIGVDLTKIVAHARERFRYGPKLSKREQFPGILASVYVHSFCAETDASYRQVVALLPISEPARMALVERVRPTSIAIIDEIRRIFDTAWFPSAKVQISSEQADKIARCVRRLGLEKHEFQMICLGKKVLHDNLSGACRSSDFLKLLTLAVQKKGDFINTESISKENLNKALELKTRNVGVSKVELLVRSGFSIDEVNELLGSKGIVTGETALKVMTACRKNRADLLLRNARSAGAVKEMLTLKAEPFGLNSEDCIALLPISQAAKEMLEAGTGRLGVDDAILLESYVHNNDLDFLLQFGLKMPLFPYERFEAELQNVATSRVVAATELRALVTRAFKSEENYIIRTSNDEGARVTVAAMVFLNLLRHPGRQVVMLGDERAPVQGDIFVHTESFRFGHVTQVYEAVQHDEGRFSVRFIDDEEEVVFGL